MAQITVKNGIHEYQQVFEVNDDFGPEYLDVLERHLPEIKNVSLRFRVYNDLGYYYHTRNLSRALEIIEEGLEEVRHAENKLWEGRLQVSQGAILLRMEELDMAEMVLRSAKEKIPEEESWLLMTNLGYVYERRGELAEAFRFAEETLKLGEKYQDKKAIAMAYSDMSNLFWKQGKYDMGVEYGQKSLALFEERGINDLDYDFTLHVMGNNLIDLGRLDEALPYLDLAAEIGEQYGFYNNLSDTYIAMCQLHSKMGELQKAEQSGKAALKYAKLLENDFMIIRSLLALGKLKNEEKQFGNAIAYLTEGIRLAGDNFGDDFHLSLIFFELSRAYEGTLEFDKAIEAYKKYHYLNGKVFDVATDNKLAEIQTRLELRAKENTISLQTEKLKQQKVLQLFIMTLAGFLVLFLFLLFRVFLKKQKYSLLLEKQNWEKEFLLKEVHHRVKNNLQTISSLLSLQAAHIADPDLQTIMTESQNRVQSIGMIHQNLYQGENLSAIEMKKYFLSLGSFIIDSFDAVDRVSLDCPMEELELDVDRAIPIGLIVNELMTNCLKYAFPENRKGKISISLSELDSHLHLTVADDGIGYCQKEHINNQGFGIHLIKLLTQQLNGKMTLTTQRGTEVSFEFQTIKAA
ncbi:tetratricopeptide repeat-containing sensor histidine kinase [Mariniradius sediminis]|uniref:histidine kinase n=1 Tax=Mariniradius sediminis TaxID=2909237 RepID=A0ABS9C2B7_9BACT|nr:histidine kinase dimerization/phosphoacceptor domain -containing protein [Mariniradius sediminis]MCF1753218.1 tetratricopeptide repeat protein [Mariniradius sediminis]